MGCTTEIGVCNILVLKLTVLKKLVLPKHYIDQASYVFREIMGLLRDLYERKAQSDKNIFNVTA